MSMEQMGGVEAPRNEQMQMSADMAVELRNRLQIDLAQRHHQDMYDFIVEHAKEVGDLLEMNPGLLKVYMEDPDRAMSEVEKIIYH